MAVDGRSLNPDYAGAFARGSQQANVLKNQRLTGELTQQQIGQGQAEAERANQFNKLSGNVISGQFDEGQNRQQAINELIANNPEKAKGILNSLGINNQQNADEASSWAYTLENTPVELRGNLIQQRVDKLSAEGRDPSDTASFLNMSPEEQNQVASVIQMAALSTKERMEQQGGGGNTPAGQAEFQNLLDIAQNPNSTQLEKDSARRALGDLAKVSTSAAERIASDPTLTTQVAESVAEIEGKKESAKETEKLTTQLKFKPQITKAVKLAEKAAIEKGEVLTDVARMEASLPGVKEAVNQLIELSSVATSTLGGRAFDFAVKESGFGSTKGADARAKLVAIVDNQVLPLLKETFGAAFTVAEGENLKASLVDPNASPSQKREQLSAFIAQKERNLRTKQAQLDQAGGERTEADILAEYGVQ